MRQQGTLHYFSDQLPNRSVSDRVSPAPGCFARTWHRRLASRADNSLRNWSEHLRKIPSKRMSGNGRTPFSRQPSQEPSSCPPRSENPPEERLSRPMPASAISALRQTPGRDGSEKVTLDSRHLKACLHSRKLPRKAKQAAGMEKKAKLGTMLLYPSVV